MKRIKNIIAIVGIVVMAVILTGSPEPSKSAPVKRFDAFFVYCPLSEPEHFSHHCIAGSTYVWCENGPCAIVLPVVVIRPH